MGCLLFMAMYLTSRRVASLLYNHTYITERILYGLLNSNSTYTQQEPNSVKAKPSSAGLLVGRVKLCCYRGAAAQLRDTRVCSIRRRRFAEKC